MKDLAGTKLAPVVAAVRRRAEERRKALPVAELERRVADLVRGRDVPTPCERFLARFAPDELALICELKRRSPSAGELLAEDAHRPHARYRALAEGYAAGGAAAFSVLTERDHFDGGLEDLARVADLGVPMLRKDFVLDRAMVLESALHGASAVLLIAALLDDRELAELRAAAREVELAVLLEVHDEDELERALPHAPELLGVNARDLRTLVTDLGTVERVLPRIPAGVVRVAESGLKTAADLRRVRAAGANAVLVGESLVTSGDALGTLRAWRNELHG
ncbi:MAG: indole-3-glycerol-phosphate synthase [Planctomycetota bacterium]